MVYTDFMKHGFAQRRDLGHVQIADDLDARTLRDDTVP